MRQTGKQDVAAGVVLSIKRDDVAIQIEDGEGNVDPLYDLGVADGQVRIGRSIGNAVAIKADTNAEPIEFIDRNGVSRKIFCLSGSILEGSLVLGEFRQERSLRTLHRRSLVVSELQICGLVLDQVAQRGGDGKSCLANLWVS